MPYGNDTTVFPLPSTIQYNSVVPLWDQKGGAGLADIHYAVELVTPSEEDIYIPHGVIKPAVESAENEDIEFGTCPRALEKYSNRCEVILGLMFNMCVCVCSVSVLSWVTESSIDVITQTCSCWRSNRALSKSVVSWHVLPLMTTPLEE